MNESIMEITYNYREIQFDIEFGTKPVPPVWANRSLLYLTKIFPCLENFVLTEV